jgi:hypothetical protein
VFNSTAAFDKHRVGPFTARRCLSDDEMLAKGMGPNRYGRWVSEKMTQEQVEGLRSRMLQKNN